MSKRAIYFDDNERECARQMFEYLAGQLTAESAAMSELTLAGPK